VPSSVTLNPLPINHGSTKCLSSILTLRLIWLSHILYNVVYFVLLTAFVYSPTLLVEFPHPLEIALAVLFFIPSLFPPYGTTFLGYLTIDILFLISFIFRGIAFRNWPYISIDVINHLLNARTLVSFLPLIQIVNLVLLIFPIPRLDILGRLIYPTFPIAITLFTGFFLTLHFLTDTHNSIQYTLDILLRTILLDIHPGKTTQFHPIAARIAFFLFAFSSLYLFWGVGIAGIGLRVARETDWHVERVRRKAVQLLRYLPNRNPIPLKRKRLLGRGKVISSMPFNVFEGIGIAVRMTWLSRFFLYLGMLLIVLGWGLGFVCVKVGLLVWMWIRRIGEKIVDEVDDDVGTETEVDSEDDLDESTRLLS
jgi:hypothetical protein